MDDGGGIQKIPGLTAALGKVKITWNTSTIFNTTNAKYFLFELPLQFEYIQTKLARMPTNRNDEITM